MSGAVVTRPLPGCGSGRVRRQFDLSLSENPFPPLPSVLAAVNQALLQANRYPELIPRRLMKLIADHVGVCVDQVVVGSGATGVAMQIMQALPAGGTRVVFGSPTFDGYRTIAAMVGLATAPVALDLEGQQDLEAMAKAVDTRNALLVLCRPHNPTGTVIPAGALEAFLSSMPRCTPIILDEAYAEFLCAADTVDAPSLVEQYPNVLVLRTFSKAYGLAGLRIGYALGDPELVGRVRRLQLPFAVTTAAVAAVAASYAAVAELSDPIPRVSRTAGPGIFG